MNWKKDEYLAHWPGAIPYPYAISRSSRPVPNRSSVDWPQAQWAPLYLQPGSPSVQPYRYPADGRIQSIVPQMYMIPPVKLAQQGPPGDTVAAQGAQGAQSCTDIDMIDSSYGAVTGPTHRMGMRPARSRALAPHRSARMNPCGCAYAGDCGCPARANEGETDSGMSKGLLVLGVAALGYYLWKQR